MVDHIVRSYDKELEALERIELPVIGFDGMFDHGACSFSRTGR